MTIAGDAGDDRQPGPSASRATSHKPLGTAIAMQVRRFLLICGIVSAVLYAAMNIFVAMQWDDYSSKTQTVSELSAIDAPTRSLWVPLGVVYTLLTAAFGWGVRKAATGNRKLRIAGAFLVAYGVSGSAWPIFPMHLREVLAAGGESWSDTMHLALASFTVLLMILAMGFGGASLGRSFRIYTIITIVLLATFGGLTSAEAGAVEVNGPTPWIGVFERLNIGMFLLWIVVLAAMLWNAPERRLSTGGFRNAGDTPS